MMYQKNATFLGQCQAVVFWTALPALWLACSLSVAQAAPRVPQEDVENSTEPHRTGRFQITVEGLDAAILRQATIDYRNRHLDLKAGTFSQETEGQKAVYEVLVPDSYDPEKPAGLIVWISPSDTGAWPHHYHNLLDEYNLIVIGANDSGNKHSLVYRAGYALQAVKLMYPNYNLDPDRIYLTGLSGGGRVTATAMMLYPDVFSGGFPMIGANTVIPMTNADSKGKKFQDSGLPWIPRSRIDDASKYGRYAFLTGENDFNRLNVKSVANGYRQRKFRHIKYVEQPKLGHQLLSPEYVEDAIVWLDEQLPKVAKKRFSAAAAFKRQSPGKSHAFYQTVIRHGQDPDQVAKAKLESDRILRIYQSELTELESKLSRSPIGAADELGRFASRWNRLAFSDLIRLKKQTD